MLFLCLLSKILSQLRQAEFPLWVYQYSTGLSTREVSSSKSISYSKKEAFVLPACYFSEVKLSYFTSLLKTFIWCFCLFFFMLIVLILFSVLFHHTSVSLPEVLWVLAGLVSRTLLNKTGFYYYYYFDKAKRGSIVFLYWSSSWGIMPAQSGFSLWRHLFIWLLKTTTVQRHLLWLCTELAWVPGGFLCPLASHCKNGTLPLHPRAGRGSNISIPTHIWTWSVRREMNWHEAGPL